MIKSVDWFTLWSEDNPHAEKFGSFEVESSDTGGYICPKCHQPATYVEGQIDEDFMGNRIDGWWFDCYKCGIGTTPVEL
jgi:hypothetical protein